MEGAGHEAVLLRFFVSDAETCVGHCHDKNIAIYFDSDLLSSDQIQQSHHEARCVTHIVLCTLIRALAGSGSTGKISAWPIKVFSPGYDEEAKTMDEPRFNMSMRKFLKVVGVSSQHEIERLVLDQNLGNKEELNSPEGTGLEHIIEGTIDLVMALSWRPGDLPSACLRADPLLIHAPRPGAGEDEIEEHETE